MRVSTRAWLRGGGEVRRERVDVHAHQSRENLVLHVGSQDRCSFVISVTHSSATVEKVVSRQARKQKSQHIAAALFYPAKSVHECTMNRIASLVLVLCVVSTFAFRKQSVSVKGKLFCGELPASGVSVKLWDDDDGKNKAITHTCIWGSRPGGVLRSVAGEGVGTVFSCRNVIVKFKNSNFFCGLRPAITGGGTLIS